MKKQAGRNNEKLTNQKVNEQKTPMKNRKTDQALKKISKVKILKSDLEPRMSWPFSA
jgi:hypothetical protein